MCLEVRRLKDDVPSQSPPDLFRFEGDFFKLLREQTKRVQDSASNDSVVSMDMDEKKIKICLPEAEARFYAGQILLALSYLSTLDICYRDLKPENILVTESGYLKLTDFGFAKRLHNSKTFTFCGTPGELGRVATHQRSPTDPSLSVDYMAPEIVSGKAMHGYGIECDLWSLGATIYEMLCGQPPFWTGNAKMTYAKILNSNQWLDWNFAHECPDISNEAKDLIRGLMHPDPSERYGSRGIKQVFEHPWFRGFSFSLLWKQAYRAPVTREQEPGRLTTHFECFDLKPYVHPKLPEGFTPAYMAQVFSCF